MNSVCIGWHSLNLLLYETSLYWISHYISKQIHLTENEKSYTTDGFELS
jgi:hypothetical protein